MTGRHTFRVPPSFPFLAAVSQGQRTVYMFGRKLHACTATVT